MKNRFASWIARLLLSGSFSFALLFFIQNSVIINWSANSEPDLEGYKLYYGNNSKRYSSVIDVGLVTSYTLENLEGGKHYYFSVTAYDSVGNESLFSDEVSIYLERTDNSDSPTNSTSVEKYYNFPNPFNPQKEVTHIRYFSPKPELVTIRIYDVFGKCIRTLIERVDKSAGEHIEDVWDGKNSNGKIIQNGIYYCLIKTSSRKDFITIVVLK